MSDSFFHLLLLALVVMAWYNWRGLQEKARIKCRLAAQEYGFQLLDDSVTFSGFKLARPEMPCRFWQRVYAFDYSRGDGNRHQGRLYYCGSRANWLLLEDENGSEWLSLSN